MPHGNYTNREYYEMLRNYIICGESGSAARRMYIEESIPRIRKNGVSDPQVPDPSTILGVSRRLLEYGQFTAPPAMQDSGRCATMSVKQEEKIMRFLLDNPSRSARGTGKLFGISIAKVNRLAKIVGRVGQPVKSEDDTKNLKPVQDPEVQELQPEDAEPRQTIARWLLEHVQENILWTSEVLFTRVALYTVHTKQWQLYNNPRDIKKKGEFNINVWGGIYKETIIGPIFIESPLSKVSYQEMLQAVINEDVEDYLPLAIWKNRDFYFMHDGTPIHYVASMKDYLDTMYCQRWIGRDGPVQWPARSPDLSPCDYFLWEEVKQRVYAEETDTLEDLKDKIIDAFEELRGEEYNLVMQRLEGNVYKRALLCLEYKGLEFEHFLKYAD